MAPGHGFADYMLFVDGQAAGVLEAKPVGYTLSSVELQADKYATGLPAGLNPPVNPLPFLYVSTGVDTRFINGLDPDPKSRRISHLPHIHRPETLDEWLKAETPTPGSNACTWRAEASIRRPTRHGRRRSAAASRRCRNWSRGSSIRSRSRRSATSNGRSSATSRARWSRWRPGPARRSLPSRPCTGSSATPGRDGSCSSSIGATSANRRRRSSRASARRTITGSSRSSTPSSA